MVGFAPCPSALLDGWSVAQVEELHSLYQRAYDLARQSHALSVSLQNAVLYHGRN